MTDWRKAPTVAAGRTSVRGFTTALVLVAFAATGCGVVRTNAGEPTVAPPAIRTELSRQVLANYVTVNNKANAKLDARLLATYEGGSSRRIDVADYAWTKSQKGSYKSFHYTKPTFYIPRLTGYPRWFVVTATSTGSKKPAPLLFQQQRAGGPWLQMYAVSLLPSVTLPEPATTADGSLAVAPPTGGTAAMTPKAVAKAYVTYLDGRRTAAAAAHRITPDAATTSLISDDTRDITKLRSFATTSVTYQVTADPTYAVPTSDGGALVMFTMLRTSSFVARPGASLQVGASPFMASGNYQSIAQETVVQLAVRVPAKGKGNLAVLGQSQSVTSLVGSRY